MYQNYTIGQTEFVLNYNYDLPQNHIARLISDFVDSIPQNVLLEDSGAATGRPSSHPAIMLKILLFAYSRQTYSGDRKSTRLNSSHTDSSRMPSSA